MKRKLLPNSIRKSLLAVPAAALMLGASQAGTTIGLNFQAWYYDSGTTPQTIGFGQGYQTTGFPVTARAFGVDAANWINTDPLPCSAVDEIIPIGSISAHLTTVNMWSGDIGNLVDPEHEWDEGYQSSVAPGNDEVTWGFEDNTGWTNTLSGLTTTFPNGYVIGLVGGVKCQPTSRVVTTAGVDTYTNAFDAIWTGGNENFSGPVGLMILPALTSDSVTFGAASRSINSAESCAIGGFIITDQPVIGKDPTDTSVNYGSTLSLSAVSFGLPDGLSYQWRHYGTNLPGATNPVYTKANVTLEDGGPYELVVANAYGSATSGTAMVTVAAQPSLTKDLAGTSSTVYAGANFTGWSVAAVGGEPLEYQWFKNGSTPVGDNSPVLTLNNVSVTDNGDYSVTVVNAFGNVKSKTNHLTVVASPDLYTTDVAQDGPISYWPLNETSGTDVFDYSGNNHFGTNLTFVSLGVPGPRPPAYQGFSASKTAYEFDGYSGIIDCGLEAALVGTTDLTLEAWINTTTGGPIIEQRDEGGFNGEYMFTVGSDGRVGFVIYGGGYQFNLTSSGSVNDGKWHHVAAVRRNGTEGVIYIDGAVAASTTSATVAPLIPLRVGIGGDLRDRNSFFGGKISDVAIYNYALSGSRIGIHAAHGLLGTGDIVLSTVAGGFVADTKPVGTLHPGINYGSTWEASVTDDSQLVTRTGVASFSGSGQIVIADSADFNTAQGTITFWLRANAPIPGPGNEAAILVDWRTTTGTIIGLDDGGGIFWQGPPSARNQFSAGYVPDNNWHHIAVTFSQVVDDTISIYIDGVLWGSHPVEAAWTWPSGQPVELGTSHDGWWKKLNGQMDDFRIYNRILTPEEIGQVFTSDALVDTSALKVRYNFDTADVGTSLTWPTGSLQRSRTLGSTADWETVSGATPPYPFLPPAPAKPTEDSMFYRVGF